MYKNILMATDGSDMAARALDHALSVAKALGASVTVVTVTDPTAVIGAGYASIAGTVIDPVPELIEAQVQLAREVLADAGKTAATAGMKVETVLVENSYPAEGINGTAERIGADLIVMGSHGRRGLGRILLGSQTSNVLAHAKVPVLVVR